MDILAIVTEFLDHTASKLLEGLQFIGIPSVIIEFLSDRSSYVLCPSFFIIAIFFIFLFLIWNNTISKGAPGILISLGILFTFIGITYALYNFDTQNITDTIPELLDGLKLAFVSSVVGLVTSIFYRILVILGIGKFIAFLFKSIRFIGYLIGISKKPQSKETAENFYDLMENIRQAVEDGNKNIKEALVGDEEESLSTKMEELRNDFKNFAGKVVEDGSQQLIRALEQVIRDFNQKINEQFGENFKKLNEAVEKLVIWQQQYKEQVEELTEIFKTVQAGIESANESVNNIQESTSVIPEHMEQIRTVFDATNARMQELYGGLQALATIREQAEQAVPTIEGYLNQILAQLKEGAERQREAIDNNIAGIEQLQRDVNTQIGEHLSKVTVALQNGAEIQRETIEKSLKDFKESQQKVTNAMGEQVQVITKQMEKDIEKALETMGNSLVPITEKLVDVYQQHQRIISNELDKMKQRIQNQQN